jgi:redox-sensitive bicupin YhaK (pirin superfamily)
MLTLRKAQDRGHADHGWLQSHHAFSFADYHDPAQMGWGNLRVLNDDRIAAGSGFGRHGHRNMEIVSYVLSGELAHQDNLGNTTTIPSGDVQRMTAGTGVLHSEFNAAPDQTTHFLQIWLLPSAPNLPPSYAQATIPAAQKRGVLCCIAAPEGTPAVVSLHADATLYAGLFDGDEHATLALNPQRKAYVFLARGTLTVNGQGLDAGDAALLDNTAQLTLTEGKAAEVLVFDLAP